MRVVKYFVVDGARREITVPMWAAWISFDEDFSVWVWDTKPVLGSKDADDYTMWFFDPSVKASEYLVEGAPCSLYLNNWKKSLRRLRG